MTTSSPVTISAGYTYDGSGDNSFIDIASTPSSSLTNVSIKGVLPDGTTNVVQLADVAAGGTLHYDFNGDGALINDFDDWFTGDASYTVTFTANGHVYTSSFSPSANATHGFVGFLGNDPNGYGADYPVSSTVVGVVQVPVPPASPVTISAGYDAWNDDSFFDVANSLSGSLTHVSIKGVLPDGTTNVVQLADVAAGGTLHYDFNDGGALVNDFDDWYGGDASYVLSFTVNGHVYTSSFSPSSNASGGFVGFLGSDSNGWETDAGVASTVVGIVQVPVHLGSVVELNGNYNVVTGAVAGIPAGTLGPDIHGPAHGGVIHGTAASETIYATGSNNVITGGGGGDVIYAGDRQATVTLSDTDGANFVFGSSDHSRVVLGDGDNTITLGGAFNTVKLGNGDNTVDAGTDAASITLGSGSNHVTVSGANSTITIAGGMGSTETVDAGAGNAFVTIGAGDSTVVARAGNNHIVVGNGNDTIDGGTGLARIEAGTGNDSITVAGTNNLIKIAGLGAAGAFSMQAVHAGDGMDKVIIGAGDASVSLNGISNIVDASAAHDVLVTGGLGLDTFMANTAGSGLLTIEGFHAAATRDHLVLHGVTARDVALVVSGSDLDVLVHGTMVADLLGMASHKTDVGYDLIFG